jgi:hypothetical protein
MISPRAHKVIARCLEAVPMNTADRCRCINGLSFSGIPCPKEALNLMQLASGIFLSVSRGISGQA